MDLEHVASPSGINEGYTFSQTVSNISLTFPIPNNCDPSHIECVFNPHEKSILAGIKGQEPILCGEMWSSTFNMKQTMTPTNYKIDLQKDEHSIWPLFILKPSIKGIDPKSQFIVGIYQDALGSPQEAYDHYCKAMERGYIPAKILVADILLSETNPYDIHQNIEEAIQILESIPFEKRNDSITIRLANALVQIGKQKESIQVLKDAADSSSIIRLELALRLSPLSQFKGKYPDEAVRHLEILAQDNNECAIELLCLHNLKGCGTNKNKTRAKLLDSQLCNLNPNRVPLFKQRGFATNAAITLSISASLIGAAAGVVLYCMRKFK